MSGAALSIRHTPCDDRSRIRHTPCDDPSRIRHTPCDVFTAHSVCGVLLCHLHNLHGRRRQSKRPPVRVLPPQRISEGSPFFRGEMA